MGVGRSRPPSPKSCATRSGPSHVSVRFHFKEPYSAPPVPDLTEDSLSQANLGLCWPPATSGPETRQPRPKLCGLRDTAPEPGVPVKGWAPSVRPWP